MQVLQNEQYKVRTIEKYNHSDSFLNYVLSVLDSTYLRNVFYGGSVFPVKFEVQSLFRRMHTSWYNVLINYLATPSLGKAWVRHGMQECSAL